MMDFNMMSGGYGSGMMFLGWITYILINALIILGIIALWKYIGKK